MTAAGHRWAQVSIGARMVATLELVTAAFAAATTQWLGSGSAALAALVAGGLAVHAHRRAAQLLDDVAAAWRRLREVTR